MAAPDEKKAMLEAADAAKIEAERSQAVADLMNPEEPTSNVVGVAAGVKWRNDEPTGEPAVVVLVTPKVDKGDLPASDLVTTKIGQVKTDVVEIGYPVAEQFRAAPPQLNLGQHPRQAMDGAEFSQAPPQGPSMLEEQSLLASPRFSFSGEGCARPRAATPWRMSQSPPGRSAPLSTTSSPVG